MKAFTFGMTAISLLISPVAMAQGNDHRGNQSEQRGNDNRDIHENNDRRFIGAQHSNNGMPNNGMHRGWGQNRGNDYRWRRGQRMGYNDWNNAQRVDYRRYHLRQPPRGYEWRQHNDRFILVAISTGIIMSVILNAGR